MLCYIRTSDTLLKHLPVRKNSRQQYVSKRPSLRTREISGFCCSKRRMVAKVCVLYVNVDLFVSAFLSFPCVLVCARLLSFPHKYDSAKGYEYVVNFLFGWRFRFFSSS